MNRDFSAEIFFRTARSGGKGGQNVNKVETMVEAWWQVNPSRFFTPEEKELIFAKLDNRINKDGFLLVKSSETRSQLENKHIARIKMMDMVAAAIILPKKRKAIKPTASMIRKRLEGKKLHGEKKAARNFRME